MAISNQGKIEQAHKMKFAGLTLKDISIKLQISLMTVNRYMKSYNEQKEKYEAKNEALSQILSEGLK